MLRASLILTPGAGALLALLQARVHTRHAGGSCSRWLSRWMIRNGARSHTHTHTQKTLATGLRTTPSSATVLAMLIHSPLRPLPGTSLPPRSICQKKCELDITARLHVQERSRRVVAYCSSPLPPLHADGNGTAIER